MFDHWLEVLSTSSLVKGLKDTVVPNYIGGSDTELWCHSAGDRMFSVTIFVAPLAPSI